MRAEANTDIVCVSLERMADIHEAAAFADVLASGGEPEIGLETFAMAAALEANPNLRYDCAKYGNPWVAGRETSESRAIIRERWEQRAPWTRRETSRLGSAQEPDETKLAKRGRKREAPAGTAKSAAKRRAAPPPKQVTTKLSGQQ